MTDIDLINIRGGDVRIDQCVGHGINDQRFKLDTFVFAELGMGPAHDATGHDEILIDIPDP